MGDEEDDRTEEMITMTGQPSKKLATFFLSFSEDDQECFVDLGDEKDDRQSGVIITMMGQPSKELAAFSFSLSAAFSRSCKLVWVAVSIWPN